MLLTWFSLRATFEQYELNRANGLKLSDKASLTASWKDRSLEFEYQLRLGKSSDEHLTVSDGGFSWERLRPDGSVERPVNPVDSVFDHGLWGMLDPGELLDASEVVRRPSADEYVLRPFLTREHRFPDGMPTTTDRPIPSWITAAPALYVSEAAFYEARLDPQQRVFESLTAVLTDRPRVAARSWHLSDVEYFNA